MKKLFLLLTLLLWFTLAQASEAESLKPLAEQGHVQVRNYLGNIYNIGLGVTQIYGGNIRWFVRGAVKKILKAFGRKQGGNVYNKKWTGEVAKHGSRDVLKWPARTANQENAKAQGDSEFQRAYKAAEAGDYKTAIAILEPLAEQGDASAQYSLAVMYYEGQGVSKHNIYSYMWLILAKANGYEEAQESIEFLIEQIPSEDIVKAQNLAKKCWDSNYKDCSQ